MKSYYNDVWYPGNRNQHTEAVMKQRAGKRKEAGQVFSTVVPYIRTPKLAKRKLIPPPINTIKGKTRKQHSAAFKVQVALEAVREAKTVAQIAFEHQLHPNLVTKWKQEAIAELAVVFERKNRQAKAQQEQEQKVAQLYEQIGRLTAQVNCLKNLYLNLMPNELLRLIAREKTGSKNYCLFSWERMR